VVHHEPWEYAGAQHVYDHGVPGRRVQRVSVVDHAVLHGTGTVSVSDCREAPSCMTSLRPRRSGRRRPRSLCIGRIEMRRQGERPPTGTTAGSAVNGPGPESCGGG